jgi:hypothetical protein
MFLLHSVPNFCWKARQDVPFSDVLILCILLPLLFFLVCPPEFITFVPAPSSPLTLLWERQTEAFLPFCPNDKLLFPTLHIYHFLCGGRGPPAA